MTNQDHEFLVTLSHDRVWGEYFGPGVDEGDLPPVAIRRDQHMETIQLLEAWLKRWEWIARSKDERLLVPDTFRVLGNHLWQMALSEVPGQRLIEAIEKVRRSRIRPRPTVRVRISFTSDADDLAALPWEFVHLAGREAFLAAETNLTLGRYVEGEGFHDADFLSADDKLRVLFVVCLPDWRQYDDERAAMRSLVRDLGQLGQHGGLTTAPSRMQLKVYQGWNEDDVKSALAEFQNEPEGGRVDVVHLTALFKRGGEHEILLPDYDHCWRWTTNTLPVVGALTADPDNMPKLVILHLCDWHETDWTNAPEHFEQLAPEFIRKDIPAVLAMQYPMRTVDGCDLVTRLYRRLANGTNIGAAVQETRNDLVSRRDRYFGTPVLYMQSRVDGGLVRRVVGEPGAGRELRPSAQKPPTESSAPAVKLVFELGRIVDEMPGTRTTNDLAAWIGQQKWPDSVTEPTDRKRAEIIIRKQRRDLNDNPEADDILRQLLRRVAELAREGGAR